MGLARRVLGLGVSVALMLGTGSVAVAGTDDVAQGAGDRPQGTAGAACAGPAWTYAHCPFAAIPATVSGGIDSVTSGELTVERPTVMALGFDWRITGDENRNAAVQLEYRRRGEAKWRKGLPLLRRQGEKLTTGTPPLKYGGLNRVA